MFDSWRSIPGGPQMPYYQLFILMICRLAEPIALTSVIPYLPEMVETFNVPEDRRAFWVGFIMASYSASQAIVAIIAGRLSDVYGRKYIILGSLSISMLTSLMFGFSRTLGQAITFRFIGGFGAGNIGIIRTMVAELVPHRSLQPLAFSLAPLVWSLGSTLGPLVGGNLAKPAEHYPSIFGDSSLLKAFPFVLPNLVNATLFAVGIAIGILYLKETLVTIAFRRDLGLIAGQKIYQLVTCAGTRRTRKELDESEPFLHSPGSPLQPTDYHTDEERCEGSATPSQPKARPATYREVFTAQSSLNIAIYTLLALHAVGYDSLIATYLHHPVQATGSPEVRLPFRFSGGLGLDSRQIGALWVIYAVWGAVIQLFIFPPVARRFGELFVLRLTSVLFPVVYLAHPFAAMLPSEDGRYAAIIGLMMAKGLLAVSAFPSSSILTTNSASSVRVLGLLNGLAVAISAVGRGAGPAIAGACFSLGVDANFGFASWIALAAFGVVAAVPQYWLCQLEGPSASTPGHSRGPSAADGVGEGRGASAKGERGYRAVGQEEEDEEEEE